MTGKSPAASSRPRCRRRSPPGETAYLVDTVSVAFVDPTDSDTVEADVRGGATDPLTGTPPVSDLRAAVGVGGGLRVTGRVQNEGARRRPGG